MSVEIKVPLSTALDMLVILDVKCKRLHGEKKIQAEKQRDSICDSMENELQIPAIEEHYRGLWNVHCMLWDLENEIRIRENSHSLEEAVKYVECSASIRKLNTERSRLKIEIDKEFKSEFTEIKDYGEDT